MQPITKDSYAPGSKNYSLRACWQNWRVQALYLLGMVCFSLVYLFIHSVTYVTMDTSITDYNLQHNL